MKRVLIACEMIRDELELAFRKNNVELETHWMDNTLHNTPEVLKEKVQSKINELQDVDVILLGYGNCGNGLLGIKSKVATIVLPRCGDCIDLFLNKSEDMGHLRTRTYFLTRGWLDGKMGLEEEYAFTLKRYGEKRTAHIMEMLYKNYRDLMLIDTGAYDLSKAVLRAEKIGELLNLSVVTRKGDISTLEKLICGDWNIDDFIILPPGGETSLEDFDGSHLR